MRTLMELNHIGAQVSIYGFGTGSSSLSYLRRLPLDHLKLARECIPLGEDDRENLMIARAILSLGASLDLTCTLEGVETRLQLACFREPGCDLVQGYLVSRPLGAEAFAEFLTRISWWRCKF